MPRIPDCEFKEGGCDDPRCKLGLCAAGVGRGPRDGSVFEWSVRHGNEVRRGREGNDRFRP
jgi:hypothetical protein